MALSFILVSSCWPSTYPIVVSVTVKYKINNLSSTRGTSKGEMIYILSNKLKGVGNSLFTHTQCTVDYNSNP